MCPASYAAHGFEAYVTTWYDSATGGDKQAIGAVNLICAPYPYGGATVTVGSDTIAVGQTTNPSTKAVTVSYSDCGDTTASLYNGFIYGFTYRTGKRRS